MYFSHGWNGFATNRFVVVVVDRILVDDVRTFRTISHDGNLVV